MNYFSVPSILLAGFFTIGACYWEGPRSLSSVAMVEEVKSNTLVAERNYLIKGMTCSGCEYSVKKALNRAGITKDQILEVDSESPDPKNKIGHAKVKFMLGQYKGAETDCKIVKEIRDNPGYVAYWDNSNTDPCGIDKK